MALLEKIRSIVSIARQIGDMVPGAFDEIKTINDAVGKIQAKAVQAHGAGEPQAPPV